MFDTTTTPPTTETQASPAAAAAPGATAEACCADAPVQPVLPPEPRLNLPAPDVAQTAALAALLADKNRAGIMGLLAGGPMCVCEMAASLGEKQNNVSMHLARLREAGLVRAVRHQGDARWMFYERDAERCAEAAALIAGLLR